MATDNDDRQTEVSRTRLAARSNPLPRFRCPLIQVSKMTKDWAVPKEGRQGGGEEGVSSSSLEQLVANLFRGGNST